LSTKEWSAKFRDFLDKVGNAIPIYNAYRELEFRRQDDKLFRELLVKRLDRVRENLSQSMKDPKALALLHQLEPLVKQLQGFQDRLRYAPYGYSGFFDRERIEASQLESIYEFDRSLLDGIDSLEEGSKAVIDAKEQINAITSFKEKLTELDRALDNRRNFIEENK